MWSDIKMCLVTLKQGSLKCMKEGLVVKGNEDR